MALKKLTLVIILFCVAGVIFQILSTRNRNSKLIERGKLTTGHVASFRYNLKSGNRVSYSFIVNHQQYKAEDEKTDLDDSHFKEFENKYMPVIYDSNNPERNKILLTKSDFQLFHTPIPDSLKLLVEKTGS